MTSSTALSRIGHTLLGFLDTAVIASSIRARRASSSRRGATRDVSALAWRAMPTQADPTAWNRVATSRSRSSSVGHEKRYGSPGACTAAGAGVDAALATGCCSTGCSELRRRDGDGLWLVDGPEEERRFFRLNLQPDRVMDPGSAKIRNDSVSMSMPASLIPFMSRFSSVSELLDRSASAMNWTPGIPTSLPSDDDGHRERKERRKKKKTKA